MNKYILILSIISLFISCKSENQPMTGSEWGNIPNGSAEKVVSDIVESWYYDSWENVNHFYDNIAYDGNKSLLLFSSIPSYGSWRNKVNLKPWSHYRLTGYVKTHNLISDTGDGASISVQLTDAQYTAKSLSGTNEWTKLTIEFDTKSDDCAIVVCNFPKNGVGHVWFDKLSFEKLSTEKIVTYIEIDPQVQKEEMSEYIYGQFIEHLGKCIYGGIWSEMIFDRKFWYAPNDKNSPWYLNTRLDKSHQPKQNKSVLFMMDKHNPYVGEHSLLINESQYGADLYQLNLGIRNNMSYKGYIVLRSDTYTTVDVTLTSFDKSEKIVLKVGKTWEKYSIEFKGFDHTNTNGILTISTKPNSKIWVGTASLMPSDNIEGFRADVLALLKGLNSPVYRWPGGNFVSGYNWRDGIGQRDKRPPRKNPAWRGVESNDVGIHEFIRLCELLGTEPYIAVNAGLGSVEEAKNQVEYINGDESTPMGKLRISNGGNRTPWGVKWWSVGNEMFGSWQLGFMSTDSFAKKHNDFAKAMKSIDHTIQIIGVGEVGKWDEYILRYCSDNMNLISEHFYCQDWHGGGLMTHALQIPRNIKRISDAHRKYRDSIPNLKDKNIKICMDEWNYWYGPHIYGELGTRYYLRDALGIAAGINEFLRQSDIVFMANYAQTVNVIGAIKTTVTEAEYASTGQVLKLYREVFGTIPVKLAGELRPLDIAASINKYNNTLTISIVNPSWDKVTIPISINKDFTIDEIKYKIDSKATLYTLSSSNDMSYNTPGFEKKVILKKEKITSLSSVTVKPFSVNIIEINI